MGSDLLARMDAFLDGAPHTTGQLQIVPSDAVVAECARLRAALSGGFGEGIRVEPGMDEEAGAYFAEVPVRLLQASGLRIVESAVPWRLPAGTVGTKPYALAGTTVAVQNAGNRVTRFLPEGWRAKLDSFPMAYAEGEAPTTVWFRLDRQNNAGTEPGTAG